MGWTCGTLGGIRKNAYRVLWENLKARVHLEHHGQIGRVTVKWILKEIGWDAVDWFHLAHVRDKWPAVTTATKIRVP